LNIIINYNNITKICRKPVVSPLNVYTGQYIISWHNIRYYCVISTYKITTTVIYRCILYIVEKRNIKVFFFHRVTRTFKYISKNSICDDTLRVYAEKELSMQIISSWCDREFLAAAAAMHPLLADGPAAAVSAVQLQLYRGGFVHIICATVKMHNNNILYYRHRVYTVHHL